MTTAPRLTRLVVSAVAAGTLLAPALVLAPAGAAPSPHGSCAEVAAAAPGSPDGEYDITSYGRTVSVWCHDMAGTPVEYLTLKRTGPGVNSSSSNNNWAPFVQTAYTRVGLDLPAVTGDPFTVRPDDFRFATTTGGSGFVRYGSGGSCGFAPGPFNIDLRGTPFAVDPATLESTGWLGHGDVISTDDQQVLGSPNARGDCGGLQVRAPFELRWIAAVLPVVGTSPASTAVTSGDDAVFTAASTGGPGTSTRWQTSTDGTTWTDVAGATTGTLTLTDVTRSMDGLRVRATFTNVEGTDTTEVATLSVAATAPVVTDPAAAGVGSGGDASFTVSAAGDPTPTLQWQTSSDAGTTWTLVPGATGTTLTLPGVTTADSGRLVRAVATNEAGTDTSESAALTVSASLPTVTAPHDLTVTAGDDVAFGVTVTGDPVPTVRWQVSIGGSTWIDTMFTGTDVVLPDAPYQADGFRFRAAATNAAGEVFSAPATLTVEPLAPQIVTAPEAVTVDEGQDAVFEVEASGDPEPEIRWQVSEDGTTWTDLDGETGTTLVLAEVGAELDGLLVRAVAENEGGSVATLGVVLGVDAVAIPTPPVPGVPVLTPQAPVAPPAAPVAVVARAVPTSSLARTGADTVDLALLAGLLVAGGVVVTTASRRRATVR
jgi:hypothetical protein